MQSELLFTPLVVVSSGLAVSALSGLFSMLGRGLQREMTVTITVDSKDDAWRWLIEFLSERPELRRSSALSVQTSFRAWGHRVPSEGTDADNLPRVAYTPAPGWHIVTFNGRRLLIKRERKTIQVNSNALDEVRLVLFN
jgi:hypothetical protein